MIVWILLNVLFSPCSTENFGDIRLFRGNGQSSGIVQIYGNNDTWTTLCGLTFTDEAAQVTCRQLGFEQGLALQLGSFGDYTEMVPYNRQFQACTTGAESRLVDCVFDEVTKCTPSRLAYASVNCFNGQPAKPTSSLQLDTLRGYPEAGFFSRVKYYHYKIWGSICAQFWDDNDAHVVCRQLGYAGGVATYAQSNQMVPILMSEVNCIGSESNIENCPQNDSICYENQMSAAVVCHQTEDGEAKLSLEGGKPYYGRVVLTIDGRKGLLCNTSLYYGSILGPWTYREASAVCRQLGYTEGYVLVQQYDSGGVQEMVLDYITCASGEEDSILQCTNGGWKNISAQCTGPDSGVSVYCYSDVRLYGSPLKDTEQLHIGRVQIHMTDIWYDVCAEVFTHSAAAVACRQLGFPVAEILMPGNFGAGSSLTSISALNCSGEESSLTECNVTVGSCVVHSLYATLLCKQANIPDDYTFSLLNSYHGYVTVERLGISGHVCRDGWDDKDATVLCQQMGHHSGIVLGTRVSYSRDQPVWASRFTCSGAETSLAQCGYQTDLSANWSCADDLVPAGALCFLNKPPDTLVRLADGVSEDHGRVEVYSDVTGWGTVCNSGWSNTDASVFCRQAGFADGQVSVSAYKTPASDLPVLLSSVGCSGDEGSIFQCPNLGWKIVPSSCLDHSRDAGVYCYRHVQLYPSSSSGAIQYHSGESYGLVCADGFSAEAAKVVCVNRGYYYGLPLCCSAFGPLNLAFTMSDVQCTGNEQSLLDCAYRMGNVTCSSGQYASVACTHYSAGFTSIKADPVVQINYFTQSGLVCSEDFTDKDATVVCAGKGFTFGKAFKYSAIGMETRIRWLRGLYCKGTESSIQQCGPHTWGQIGVCSWDSVAAVICSNSQGDMEFDLRLSNGSDIAGRVEIEVNGTWGTVCGLDLTRNEAKVICRQLGYHDGISMAPGHFGSGSGDVILSGIDCQGNESSVERCIWAGHGQATPVCDHSKDAAVTCFYKTRLVGSTTINYGRLEMYDSAADKWLAVCDRDLNVNDANIICRQMGFVAGMYQEGSPLGPTSSDISIVAVTCPSQSSECSFTKGDCRTSRYVALYCSYSLITAENVDIRLPLSSCYGPVSIKRFGLWGHICSKEFDDKDAVVVCSQLGYRSGAAVRTFKTPGFPIIQGSVRCLGNESSLSACPRGLFAQDPGCYNETTVAGVICYDDRGLSYGSSDLDHEAGRMSTSVNIAVNSQILYVSQVKFTSLDAAVYCSALSFAGGESSYGGSGAYGVGDLSCTGTEESILQCPGNWDPEKTRDKSGDLAGVTCFTAVRLVGGDPKYYGIVFTSKGVNSGPVCAEGFDETDAGIACKSLGFESGIVLCCAPYGAVDQQPVMTNVQCTGSEKQFTDCPHSDPDTDQSCSRNYAAVACYSGTKPTDYKVSFPATDTSVYAGNVVLTYMGINGSICMDGWDDQDAHVVCREMGFQTGIAYNAAKSVAGPYWTSDVTCQGTENRLSQCQKTPFGQVTGCKNLLSHAGAICYGTEGVYSRLYGTGEVRYGRVELYVAGEWRSLCNAHWDNEDANVLCKMLDFRAGDALQGTYNETIEGPVWDINFRCNGSETTLTECLSSGWKSSTSAACARHENDAGAFCYTSVKLSTGVGRQTDQGAVLLYKDNMWYTVCNDGFTSTSARAVCRELGFLDGQVQCCTDYGKLENYPRLQTHKVQCDGDETDVTDCLVEEACDRNADYASVVCYGFVLGTSEPVTQAPDRSFDALPVIIAVVVFVCLLIIAVLVFYLVRRYRRQKKLDATKKTFSRTSMKQRQDGSFAFENVMHDDISMPSGTPTITPGTTPAGTPGLPRVSYNRQIGEQSAEIVGSFNNPGYMNAKDSTSGSHIYDNLSQLTGEPRETKHSDYDIPRSNRTVINITSDQNPSEIHYDNKNTAGNRYDSHVYDSLKYPGTDGVQTESDSAQNRENDTERIEGDQFTTLADQAEVSSPTEEKSEFQFSEHKTP